MALRSCSALAFAAIAVLASTFSPAQSVSTRHVREATRNGSAPAVGRLPDTQTLRLDLVLPLRDQTGLTNFLTALYDRTSPTYRHFLTVDEFTQRFGPTQADYDAVLAFASTHGLTVVGGSRDAMDVQVTGSVTAVERAFHINLRNWQHPSESRTFYAPDAEPTTDLPFALWHISGLDNFSTPQPQLTTRSEFAAAHGISSDAVLSHATTGSGPSASFLGSDMRAAYYGGTALTGAGQNLGLLEYLGTDLADLNTYFSTTGQTNSVPITLLSTDGTSVNCVHNRAGRNCDDTEQTLDMTQALGMAPNLASLVMYVGSSDTAIIGAMTSHSPLPTTIGCSWGWTPVDPSTLDPYFKRMAAQGQTFLAASGDASTWSSSTQHEPWPADDPYVVSVGGTDLITAGPAGPWASETAWLDSGGGISPNQFAIPSWQQLSGVINSSNRGSTTYRNGPDIAANANFTFYTCADQTACLANQYGGTSFAAPMWAAYLALVNQQLATNNQSPIGFLNPTIYAQNITSAYAADFHDITSGASGNYSAVPGYDLVTGWGSPTAALITALTGSPSTTPPPTPSFTLAAAPSSASVVEGHSVSFTIATAVSGGFSAPISLSAVGAPSGSTITFSPVTIAAPGTGSSTLTIKIPRNIPAGSRTITITATGGGLTQTTTVTLTVTFF
jgi:subtilase family serine protease